MCGGGGTLQGGNDATYFENRDRDERREEQIRADASIAKADKDKADARKKFDDAIKAAPTTGRNVATKYLTSRGLSADDPNIDDIVNSIIRQIPDLDPNPNKYFTNEAVRSEFDEVAEGTRDRLEGDLGRQFAPGFEKTLIADTADDKYLDSILGEQRGRALKVVDFNKARGLLNDTGYQAALSDLDTQGSAGRSSLTGIGNSVLGTSRQALTDIRGDAGTAASGYDYGETVPDISSYYGRARDRAATDLSGLEGSIRAAVGTTNFFDAPTALQAGGTMQGPINLASAAAPGPLGAEKDKRTKGRGIGSTGVF